MDSRSLARWQAAATPVLDIHELAAGKLAALLVRRQARDLFDSRPVLSMDELDAQRLRTAFVVYAAMNRLDWRTVSVHQGAFDGHELSPQLAVALRIAEASVAEPTRLGNELVDECRDPLSAVLWLNGAETAFLDLRLDSGKIDGKILTEDVDLRKRIAAHSGLWWKAQNVRKRTGLNY